MNKLERILAEDDAFRRGLLLTTNEKKVAKARAEALNAKAQLEQARKEAQLARDEAEQLREHIIATSTKSPISFRTMAATFTIVLLVAAVSKLVYVGFTSQPKAPPVSHTAIPSVVEAAAPRHILTHKPPSAGDIQFKHAMLRLQDDLGSLPEAETEVVREVNERYPAGSKPCPLEWVNGEAALSLDGDRNRIAPSLTTAVTQCAAAVERYRDQRDATLSATASSAQ